MIWTPEQTQIGQIVGFRVVAEDTNGAETFQDLPVRVTEEEPPNRDPEYTSTLLTAATVGELYTWLRPQLTSTAMILN